MKMDKQALAKHHFWIMLGVFALLAVILLIVIPVGVGGQIEAKQQAYTKMDKDLDANKTPKSKTYIAKLDDQKEKLGVQREKIHKNMYERQKDLLAFPGDLYDKYKSKDFGSPVDLPDRLAYRTDEVYMQQYQDMAESIKPTEFAPDWPSVLLPIAWSDRVAPSDEEVWLSVEDMCVRREVLKVLHDANEATAAFQIVKSKDPVATKLPFQQKFRSRLWELDLTLDKKDRNYVFRGTLKNISGRMQQIYKIDLNVWVIPDFSSAERSKPVVLPVLHDKLSADEVLTLPETPVTMNQAPTGLFRVEQVLTSRTVPIKRLTNLTLSLNAGHRMADRKLLMAKISQVKDADKPAETPSNPNSPGISSAGMGFGSSKGPMGASGGSTDAERTPNGLIKARYIELTDQVRRMPVALVVTVDQADVPDLLVALENTPRMRFQLTQYHWQRIHGGLAAPTSGGSPAMPTNGGGAALSGTGPRQSNPGAGSGVPVGGAAAGNSGPTTLENEQSSVSLVDLTVYGVINVYERPKDAPAPASTVTPKPATPVSPKAADVKPAETKPAETKPADTKPAETKPAETKPAVTKPAETKPTETKPPTTDKPNEAPPKPAAPTNPTTPKTTK